jgi:hypothetical protein
MAGTILTLLIASGLASLLALYRCAYGHLPGININNSKKVAVEG